MEDKKPKKKKFFVEDGETISDCLQRMATEGYTPIRRSEEPIFEEVKKNGIIEQQVKKQKIVFEGKIKD